MTLQARLAELITARGAEVLADPGEFRAALDDYLTDEEISPGDRNVLVDAVRLDAVRRLLGLLDQGSDPRAAINEAGLALARERGSDDPRRSLRATALLGYAVGRIDEDVVRSFEFTRAPARPTPPPYVPDPASGVVPPTRVVPPTPPPTSAPAAAAPAPASWPVPAAAPGSGGRRRMPIVIGAAAVAVLLVAGLAVWWFALRGETPEEGLEEWFSAGSCEEAADRMTGSIKQMLEDQIDDEGGICAAFTDYSIEYDVVSVDENGDRATVKIEGTEYYDGTDETVPDEEEFSATFDLRRIDGEWLVSDIHWPDDE
ncbi:hypothetical protein D0Z08_09560 [Nocardioides immobilis]|uniref:DUF4878 domain-containing protein n=1 Tax=Nocardioides immobilis TaxID=2049295 RepID=A0A417Y462_9ACTN|nr:hypothetical protein [Nocardioides immobilis]RHW27385.1 hypothetical protein D0Z08_09560 [Nocardioides immobilis]